MKTITYDPRAGTHITDACKEAVALAINGRQNVQFSFNGVELLATPDSVIAKLEAEFSAKLEADAKAYRESPKGIAAANARTREITKRQDSVTALFKSLPGILSLNPDDMSGGITRDDALMGWLNTLTIDGDDIGVDWNKASGLKGGGKEWMAVLFMANGFQENEHVGEKPEWFNTRKRMARYIIGQVIACLRKGMPPHPVTARFIEDYFRIKE